LWKLTIGVTLDSRGEVGVDWEAVQLLRSVLRAFWHADFVQGWAKGGISNGGISNAAV
jgi:hypothetical protein